MASIADTLFRDEQLVIGMMVGQKNHCFYRVGGVLFVGARFIRALIVGVYISALICVNSRILMMTEGI